MLDDKTLITRLRGEIRTLKKQLRRGGIGLAALGFAGMASAEDIAPAAAAVAPDGASADDHRMCVSLR